jgi:hypothetical protein
MPLQLALSHVKALPFDFAAEVEKFRRAKLDHLSTVGEPAPSAPHHWVEDAVRRVPGSIDPPRVDDFVADFEIVDDTPPAPTLDQRKQALAHQAAQAFHEAQAKIVPPLKARLVAIEVQRAMMVEEAKRSPAQAATLKAADDRNARLEMIHFHLATLESEIHDLTEDSIETWRPKAFPA